MIFLIDYDRRAGKIIAMQTFEDSAVEVALRTRLDRELEASHRGIDREIVLLDAPCEAALRRTHGRYFKNARELVEETLASDR